MSELIQIDRPPSLFDRPDLDALAHYNPAMLPTEDDLPCDDGEPMETPRHRDQMNLLIESLSLHWGDRRRYFVGGNMFLHFELNGDRTFRGPDVFLVLDVDLRERKSWVVWQENMRFPDMIIELLSDSTQQTDRHVKKRLYERTFKTAEYYLFDPYTLEFRGYHLFRDRYHEVLPDRQQRIYSPVSGLWLAVRDDRLRWLSPDGYILPTWMEQAEMERQRVELEMQRAEQESQRAEQESQRAEQESQRAEQESQRAEQAEARAELEKQRAELAEQRARQLAEQLKALGISIDDIP